MRKLSALAIAAHPDDIEFMMGGTLCLLKEVGFQTHYLNIASGSCGSQVHRAAALCIIRRREARQAAAILGAVFHPGRVDDLEILYTVPLLRWLVGVIRRIRPAIILTHSPQDYMEDHTNVSRLAVTAAFARGMPNFRSSPPTRSWPGDTAVYHAMPHGLRDGLRRPVVPGLFVDTGQVQEQKRRALACHRSQRGWLEESQGMDSYLQTMDAMSRAVGRMSRRYRMAEGWRRHSPLGFGPPNNDPLVAALGSRIRINRAYERALRFPP